MKRRNHIMPFTLQSLKCKFHGMTSSKELRRKEKVVRERTDCSELLLGCSVFLVFF